MSGRSRNVPVSPFLDAAVKQFEEVRSSIPGKVAAIDSAFSNHFRYGTLSEAAAAFKGSVPTNAQLNAALALVRDVLSRATKDIAQVELWLTLKNPQAEDGNNFGVIILHEVAKAIAEYRKQLATKLEALPDYYTQRSGAVEKIATRVSTDVKESSSKSSSTGGKEGAEDKTSKSSSEEKSTKAQEPLPDQVDLVTAIDVKWYNILQDNLEAARFAYIAVDDVLTKNYEKLNAPKGDKTSGSHLSMF